MTHTPGPWQAQEGSYGNYINVGAGRGTVARIPWGKDGTDYDNSDAHLIAAAPDLLSALEVFVARYPNNVGAEDARAVIAKATK